MARAYIKAFRSFNGRESNDREDRESFKALLCLATPIDWRVLTRIWDHPLIGWSLISNMVRGCATLSTNVLCLSKSVYFPNYGSNSPSMTSK